MCDPPVAADELIARNMLRDLVPCSEFDMYAESLGFVPASPDVAEIEHRQCHMRRANIEPIIPAIVESATCAGSVAHGMAEFIEGTLPPESRVAHVSLCRLAALAVIAHLVDFGYLEVAGGKLLG
jgi:hypothetical protein